MPLYFVFILKCDKINLQQYLRVGGIKLKDILEVAVVNINEDIVDYIGIFSPILLSVIAILISMWNSFWAINIKRVESNLVWDDLFASFFIIIRNTGRKTLVIKSVSLVAYDNKNGEMYELGTRENAWAIKQNKGYIKENEAIVINPMYGSIYDVFAYYGRAFDVDESNRDLPVELWVKDIDNKIWKFKTSFVLGEIDEKMECAVTVE